MNQYDKALIIGIDGATWDILTPLIEEGHLPNLSRLTDEGVKGELRSIVPPVTAPAWTSFQTGVNPGKHGIYDFQNFDNRTHESSIVNSSKIPLPTIWDLANSSDLDVATVNVPMTYPPSETPGRVTIGGLLSPKEGDYMYPEELKDPLLNDIGYMINGGPLERRISMDLDKFIEEETEVERRRFKSARFIMDNHNWDLFMIHIQSSDGIQHCYYPFLDPNSSKFTRGKYDQIIPFYEEMDRQVGKLLDKAGDVPTFIISDHGFRELKTYINLNAWLRDEGYLKTSGPNLMSRLVELARRIDFLKVGKRIIGKFMDDFLSLRNVASDLNTSSIDWDESLAFMPNGTVFGTLSYLNDVGSASKREIEQKLLNLTEPDSDIKSVTEIHRRDDCFCGERKDSLPDLFLHPGDGYAFGVPMVMEKNVFRDVNYPSEYLGTHAMNGIIVANGPGIKSGHRLNSNPVLYDVAPTIMAVLGLPVPSYMDGKVLTSLFSEELKFEVEDRPDPYRDREGPSTKTDTSEEVKDRLEDLGYL